MAGSTAEHPTGDVGVGGRDDKAHGAECGLHRLGDVSGCHLASLTGEDLAQNEEPAHHSYNEAHLGVAPLLLTHVAEGKHDDGAAEQTPEHPTGDVGVGGREDEEELDHLQGHSQSPVDVSVDDRRGTHSDPVLAHVEVVHTGDEGHEGAHVHRGLPVSIDRNGLHEKEDGGCDHGDGDDPEGDSDGVMGVQEAMVTGGSDNVSGSDVTDHPVMTTSRPRKGAPAEMP